MDEQISNNIRRKLKNLAYYQIFGGGMGLIMLIWLIAQTITITGLIILMFLFTIGLYSFSIYCGRLLLKGDYDLGLRLSTINQALQIFSIALLGFAFMFIAGISIGVVIDYTYDFNFKFLFSLSNFQVSINQEEEVINLGFNFVPVFLIQYIVKIKNEIDSNKFLQTYQSKSGIPTIGQEIPHQENEL